MIKGPPLSKNQYALIIADGATGHVYNTKGTISLGVEDIYFVFDSLDAARAFVFSKRKENQAIEFSIYNSNYEPIEYFGATI